MTKTFRKNTYRLRGYDYSQRGAYFVTICVCNRRCLFGEVINGQMQLNSAGIFAQQCWQEIPKHFAAVELNEFVIMPNHIHGIIVINNEDNEFVGVQAVGVQAVGVQAVGVQAVGVQHVEPPQGVAGYQRVIPGSLGAIVRGFKSAVTRWFHANTQIKTVWQRNFHDHIVRNEPELNRISMYIRRNPAKWEQDRQNRQLTSKVSEAEALFSFETWMI